MNDPKTVSVIGLGKLGLPTAVHFASRGIPTIGVDKNHQLVADLNASIVRSTEPGLLEAFLVNHRRFRATVSVCDAISTSTITFVIVPTPSLPSGEFSTEYVRDAGKDIGIALKRKLYSWHLVVLVSTVLPGATRQDFIRTIEDMSGKECGVDFGVCYNPEFIALGSVLGNLSHPDYELVGESDSRSGNQLEAFYNEMFSGSIPIRRMSLESAELVKIATNAFVTTKISSANTLAAICEKLPGVDVKAITGAIGMDKRIGPLYLQGGLGFGGPCFPRDNRALSIFARGLGVDAAIAKATDSVNSTQVSRLIARTAALCGDTLSGKKIAVIGLSYKPNTSVIEESQAMEIVGRLIMLNPGNVTVFDKKETIKAAHTVLGDRVVYATSLTMATELADIIVIAVADKSLVPTSLKNGGDGVIIVDPWRLIDPKLLHPNTKYLTVGQQ